MTIADQNHKLTLAQLKKMAEKTFGNFVKAVIDIDRGIMVVDAEMHADQEAFLLEDQSKQENLWGINLYPDKSGDEFIEFDSMINIRPWQENRSRGVDSPEIRKKIINFVSILVTK